MDHNIPSPYAVKCDDCGTVHMTKQEYESALTEPGGWSCPQCGSDAQWDDGNFASAFGLR